MALSWRRGPHLQPTPPSVSSVLLAPSLPLSLFKPPPVRDLYDPDALLGVQDLPCSCTPSCLSVTCCLSLSCILCIPARLGQYPVISCLFLCHNVASCWMPTPPTPASLLPWLNCPYLWFGSNAVSSRNPRLSSGDRCWVCSCKGDALLSPTPREVFP